MEKSGPLARLLEHPAVYRFWQAPFASAKVAPLLATAAYRSAQRVLDAGCGPGTNARYFRHCDYLGLDINPAYIAYARRRFGDRFEVADVTRYLPPEGRPFDFILLNSLLHHLEDGEVEVLLQSLQRLLSPDGAIHILDLVLPDRPSVARTLAKRDRGEHPRPLENWRGLFAKSFAEEAFLPYPLGLRLGGVGLTLWNMVYFRGRLRP